ncbi:uncharacterized protein N7515_007139 [Penicillium bovifimosum]|uniref:Uncharacterized protein n=1 Tax=Penicillium bovifimosum TaxID=126998 RepID=A0A9W9GW15_9EURO|nr:uncharacterized protein N7515_007139 [Penicillium bovifimosum]KAJ5131100.1 hypothetical protein N7515_007139 [Penicillium bovifimosum]
MYYLLLFAITLTAFQTIGCHELGNTTHLRQVERRRIIALVTDKIGGVRRCWDNSLNTQPLNVRAAWNWGLHVTSSAHRIKIYSVNKTHKLTQQKLAQFKEHDIPLAPLTRYDAVPGITDREIEKYQESHPRDVDE